MANMEEENVVKSAEILDEDSGMSMQDVLEEQQQLEDDANAVLGGSDARNCTYDMGYIPRQALYSCATCKPVSDDPAGVCLACSLECHDGHDLYELYTKRNFRCDCGNSKFGDQKCKLRPGKKPTNADNHYNQNFQGLYCICHRPYPDPDDNTEDDMIQCIVCEDWYHGRHLKTKPPSSEDYDEMICSDCMRTCDFIWTYMVQSEEVKITKAENTENIDIETPTNCTVESKTEAVVDKKKETVNGTQSQDKKQDESHSGGPSQSELPTVAATPPKSVPGNAASCHLEELQKREVPHREGSTFWTSGWRKKLCTCDKCKKMYEEKQLTFLLDEDDTVQEYERQGQEKTQSQYDQGMAALNSMDRVQQVEVISGYNDLKTELKDYLKKFAENKKMVREEDIKEFFSQMEARKRQRTDHVAIPHFCK